MYLLLEPEADNLVWPRPEDMSTILHTPLDTSLRPVTTVTMYHGGSCELPPTMAARYPELPQCFLGRTPDLGRSKAGVEVQGHREALYTACFFFLLGIY